MIQAITCDITKQNATLYPEDQVHTIDLSATLPTCGSECCPLGYDCAVDGNCAGGPIRGLAQGSSSSSGTETGQRTLTSTAAAIQSSKSGTATQSASKMPWTTMVQSMNSTTVATNAAPPSTSLDQNGTQNGNANRIELAPGTLAGVIIGIIGAAIFCFIAITCILKRRRQTKTKTSDVRKDNHATPISGKPELDAQNNQLYEKGTNKVVIVEKDGTVLAEKQGTDLVEKDGAQVYELEATARRSREAAATRVINYGSRNVSGK